MLLCTTSTGRRQGRGFSSSDSLAGLGQASTIMVQLAHCTASTSGNITQLEVDVLLCQYGSLSTSCRRGWTAPTAWTATGCKPDSARCCLQNVYPATLSVSHTARCCVLLPCGSGWLGGAAETTWVCTPITGATAYDAAAPQTTQPTMSNH